MITGISVTIKVGPAGWSDSTDPLYLGIYGKDGGREFALDVDNYNEFDAPNKIVKLKIGNGCCSSEGELQVRHSDPYGGSNTPLIYPLDLEDVEYVYLRKIHRMKENAPGDQTHNDDLLELASAKVVLCDNKGHFRKFEKNLKMFFGFECGLQHWLEEGNKPGCRMIVQLDSVQYSGDNIGKKIAYNLVSTLNNSQSQVIVNKSKHVFKRGTTEYVYKNKQYFQEGCCKPSNTIKLKAFVKEFDPIQDDQGDETIELTVNCCGEQPETPFTFTVNVYAMFNKVAHFTFKGKVITIYQP